jgi:Peptidase C39 family
LIDRRAGGIAADVLTAAVESQGWRVARVDGSIDALGARVHDGQPVIVLLPDRGDRYHYVVVTAVNADGVIVHDPAWGPSRPIRNADFERAWSAAGFWSLLILPDPARHSSGPRSPDTSDEAPVAVRPAADADRCDARLNRALETIRAQGLDRADALLGDVRTQCPTAIGPVRELSGLRFAQRRWSDAVALAHDVLRRDPHDAYTLDLLGSALFMEGDDIGALRAWNRIGKPRVNRLRIDGLHHTRYQTLAELIAIQPNMLLTAETYGRARQRLGELPDHATTRLAVKPEADGFATVDVVVVEIAALPRGPIEWAGAAARTAASRTVDISVPGGSGQGEVWSAGWRWWNHRPAVNAAFAAPHVRGLPGVWRIDGSWQSDTYDGPQGARIVESRTHGGLTISDWLSSRVRYSITSGLDAWGSEKAASVGGSLERVALADRLTLSIGGTHWMPLNGGLAFGSMSARAGGRSSTEMKGWVMRGEIGVERVGNAAPLALWPGAGEGQVRAPLLRAHPLLNDGVVDLSAASVFGRTVAFGSGELQRWLERPPLVRVGVAAFTDVARASRQASGGQTAVQVDVGAGLRIKIPGTPGVLRADIAHGIRDGRNALTFGWLF